MTDSVFAVGLTIPFIGTTLGAAMVFALRSKISPTWQKSLLGFASGVMIAASVWSLLIPSIEMCADRGKWAVVPAVIGFLAGMFFLLILDTITPHLHLNSEKPEGVSSSLKKSSMLVLAVTLHNIPEGMAVGVTLAGASMGDAGISLSGALALALGMAIQNFPEGAIISMPLRASGCSRRKSFGLGVLSGLVEPIFGILTILLIDLTLPILPYLLAFSAGAMIYVVVEELIPESQEEPHSNVATIGVALGFVLMMVLDVVLA